MVSQRLGDIPSRLDDFIGQSVLTQRLSAALSSGRVYHAYILLGDKLTGKRTLTRVFASMLLCEHPTADGPCGQCGECRRMSSGNHPDYHVFSLPKGKTHIDVEQIRALGDAFSLKAYAGKRCIAVIENAETMTPSAQNALLKTLEEPPEGCVLFLLCTSLAALLPTVLSRCALLRIHPLNEQQIEDALTARGAEPSVALLAAQLSRGSLGKALQLATSPAILDELRQAKELLLSAMKGEKLPFVLNTLSDRKTDLFDILDTWEELLSSVLTSRHTQSNDHYPEFSLFSDSAIAYALSACEDTISALSASAIKGIAADGLVLRLNHCRDK